MLVSIFTFPGSSFSFRNEWIGKFCPSNSDRTHFPSFCCKVFLTCHCSEYSFELSYPKFFTSGIIIETTLGHESFQLVVREIRDTIKIMVPGDHDRGIIIYRRNTRDFDIMTLTCLVGLNTLY